VSKIRYLDTLVESGHFDFIEPNAKHTHAQHSVYCVDLYRKGRVVKREKGEREKRGAGEERECERDTGQARTREKKRKRKRGRGRGRGRKRIGGGGGRGRRRDRDRERERTIGMSAKCDMSFTGRKRLL